MNIEEAHKFLIPRFRGAWALPDVSVVALAEAVRDAERYRWLRTAGAWDSEVGLTILSENPKEFDAAVDERMARETLDAN